VVNPRHAPAALPRGSTRYPLYRKLGGPGLDWFGKSRLPPGFGPRTVHRVASRSTDFRIVHYTVNDVDKNIEMLLIYTSQAGSIPNEKWKSIRNHELNMQETVTDRRHHNGYTTLTLSTLETAISSGVSPSSLAMYNEVSE
jgi:hypothetical protein